MAGNVVRILVGDVICIIVVGLLLLVPLFVEPHHRGYFEDDLSLRLPFKSDTISTGAVTAAGFVIAIVLIIITELVLDKTSKSSKKRYLLGGPIPPCIWESYCTGGVYVFGAACQQLTTSICKYTIGRLRPHFYDLCRPVPNTSNLNALGYIQDYTCTGENTGSFKNMRLSFPSGHSSFSMYTAVFCIIYIHLRWRPIQFSSLLLHVVQLVIFLSAWFTGLSRVMDHMHFWSDVTAGFIIGAFFAVAMFAFVLERTRGKSLKNWCVDPSSGPQTELPRPVLTR